MSPKAGTIGQRRPPATPLRFLHTSDWHLGHTLRVFERSYEHDRFLTWLLETLEHEHVDALLVAGDLFDSANPPVACQRRLFQFLADARRRMPRLNIVLVAGNHDSGARVEAPSPLLDAFGITVVGLPKRRADGSVDIDSLVVPLTHADGTIGAWCMAVPFLRPGDVQQLSHQRVPVAQTATATTAAPAAQSVSAAPSPAPSPAPDAYAQGIASLYQDALAHALSRREPGQAIVAMGHLHLVGGRVSEDSERRIVIGGAQAMPADMFGPEIAYVALGHLHLAQTVGHPHRRYCGSPLPMSFGEIDYPHQVVLGDLDGDAVTALREVRVPRSVDLLRVPESPGLLEDVLQALRALELPTRDEAQWPYLEVRVRLQAPEPGLRARVEQALEGKQVRLARIVDVRDSATGMGTDTAQALPSLEALERLDPAEVFAKLYRDRFGNNAPQELTDALTELMQRDTEGAP